MSETIRFVVYKTTFGSHTDVYRNGELISGVWKANAEPVVEGGYTVSLEFIDGPVETFHVDSLAVVPQGELHDA